MVYLPAMSFSALTHKGIKRKTNQDSILVDAEHGLYLVADGVGGRKGGERASAVAAEVFSARAPALFHLLEKHDQNPGQGTRNQLLEALDATCQQASNRVYEMAEAEDLEGAATTLIAAVLGFGYLFLAHVGDSRAYLLRNGELIPITEDHTLINHLIRQGKLTPEEAKKSAYRHVITRAVGHMPSVQSDLICQEFLPGDRLLLCSDGLYGPVDKQEIVPLLSEEDPEDAARDLLQAALDHGGPDNVSVIVADPEPSPESDMVSRRAHTLSSFFLFHGLPFSELARVSRVVREMHVSAGELVVAQGAPGRTLYAVVTGELVVERDGVVIARLGDGAHFGELSLTDSRPRSASVTAASPAHLTAIDRAELNALCRRDPDLGTRVLWNLLETVSQRLRETTRRLADQG